MPIEQSAWCPAVVAKVRAAASCQNTHPAGTVPSNSGTPFGTASGKAIAMGGRDRSSASVSRSALTLAFLIHEIRPFVGEGSGPGVGSCRSESARARSIDLRSMSAMSRRPRPEVKTPGCVSPPWRQCWRTRPGVRLRMRGRPACPARCAAGRDAPGRGTSERERGNAGTW